MTEAARAETPADARSCADLLPRLHRRGARRRGGSSAAASRRGWRRGCGSAGRISNAALEADQYAAHGLAWMATYAEALRAARRLGGAARGRRAPSARWSG